MQFGNNHLFIGFIRDISEQKKMDSQIVQFAHIIEGSLNEIYLFNSDTLKFIQVNMAAQRNLNYSMKEHRRLTLVDINPELSIEYFF